MKPNLFRASAAAVRLREKYSIDSPFELELESLARCLDIEVLEGRFTGFDAYLMRSENSGIIRVRGDVVPGRRRFSIAHELGHWHLHPKLQQLCTSEDMNDYVRSPEEIEANTFAAELLLPKDWISEDIFRSDPSFRSAKSIADDLQVSLTCAARRFVELSKQPLILLSSNNGRIRSITRSKVAEKRGFWIPPGTQISPHSHTAVAIKEGTRDLPITEVDSDIWFDEDCKWQPPEVFEGMMDLPAFATTLTLLWMP